MAKRKSKSKSKSNTQSNNQLMAIVISLIPILMYGSMLKYIFDLEKNKSCECSNTENRETLKKLIIGWIGITIVLNLLPFLFGNNGDSLRLLLSLVSFGLFVYLSITFYKYEKELYISKCDCSKDIKRTVFRYYLYIGWGLFALNLLFVLFYMMLVVQVNNQNQPRVVKANL
tara:strand:+ start:582 stop:1097 length:516 start_codon:yes stop_codon:yes gene_type:complete